MPIAHAEPDNLFILNHLPEMYWIVLSTIRKTKKIEKPLQWSPRWFPWVICSNSWLSYVCGHHYCVALIVASCTEFIQFVRRHWVVIIIMFSNVLFIFIILSIFSAYSMAQGSSGCINSCCINCQEGTNCEVCYLLNTDTMACPCVDNLTEFQRAALIDGAELFPKFSSTNKTRSKSSPLQLLRDPK